MPVKYLTAMALALVLVSGTAVAQDFSDKQKEQIEAIVRELITKKEPQIVMDAAREFQRKSEEESTKKASEAIGKYKDKLHNQPADPVVGNEKGDVTVVQFFDYNCGYCKKANETVRKLVETDKNVKIVMKEYPILSESSRTAARAALAANKQKKYFEFHNALMEHKGALSDDAIMEVAGKVGLDKDKLKKDMEGDDIKKEIETDLELGREVGARGTPTFIIEDKLVPGAMDIEELKSMIADARKAKKK